MIALFFSIFTHDVTYKIRCSVKTLKFSKCNCSTYIASLHFQKYRKQLSIRKISHYFLLRNAYKNLSLKIYLLQFKSFSYLRIKTVNFSLIKSEIDTNNTKQMHHEVQIKSVLEHNAHYLKIFAFIILKFPILLYFKLVSHSFISESRRVILIYRLCLFLLKK